MDLPCLKCQEPWDFDSLHEEAEGSGRSYKEVAADFRRKGCLAMTTFGAKCDPDVTTDPMVGEIYALLGDDMDGAAAMLEDYERSLWCSE